jgi:peptidoglycan/xylan/chitin deacetylase (PgdA/CDA1 family)
MTALPHYYSTLAPFREAFLTGWPILTYHHVGPRRRGARIKGLYVSPRLFARQLNELRAAGYTTPPYRFPLGSTGGAPLPRSGVRPAESRGKRAASGPPRARGPLNAQRQVWLTFDDGFADVFEHAFPILQELGCRGILFLVSSLLGQTNKWQQRAGDVIEPLMDAAQVRDWLAAGQQIGAHTQTHPRLTQLCPAAAREEILASKQSLEDRFGLAVAHFCYPYGDWNEPVRDLVMEAGYQSACTTRSGINGQDTPRFELMRLTARYPTRSLRAAWLRLRGRRG